MAAEVLHEARDDFDPVAALSAELLQKELDRFEALLTDLLEISRFDAGAATLNLEEADLRDLVQRVVEADAPLAETNHTEITVHASGEAKAEVEPRRIEINPAQSPGQRHRAQRGSSDRYLHRKP